MDSIRKRRKIGKKVTICLLKTRNTCSGLAMPLSNCSVHGDLREVRLQPEAEALASCPHLPDTRAHTHTHTHTRAAKRSMHTHTLGALPFSQEESGWSHCVLLPHTLWLHFVGFLNEGWEGEPPSAFELPGSSTFICSQLNCSRRSWCDSPAEGKKKKKGGKSAQVLLAAFIFWCLNPQATH